MTSSLEPFCPSLRSRTEQHRVLFVAAFRHHALRA
jgi:hypothetical protein